MTTSSNASAQDVFSSASAFWSNVNAWSFGASPTAAQDAFIGASASGAASADVRASVTVNSIAVNAASTLIVDAGKILTATNGSTLDAGDVASLGIGNSGTILATAGGTLALGGSFVNKGGIEIARANLGDSGALKLIGDVTLSGGGHIDLGLQQGAAATTAPIYGGGLINIDNTISGAGVISLATLDNRAGGFIVASQSSDDDLAIDVAQMSNEGALRVGTGALMTLGHDGQSRTLANTGVIAVGYEGGSLGANALLQIAGDFTLSGSGVLNLMGNNGQVGSDGASATFTNAGAIVATSSGEIGDGGGEYDDLTFVNSGTVTATGAGVTLALYTPTFAIADSGLIQALSGANLVLGSEVDLSGAGALIKAGAGGTVQILAAVVDEGGAGGLVVEAGGKMTLASSAVVGSVTIEGASGATAGGALTVQAGASISGALVFASAGAVLNLVKRSGPLTVTGDDGYITLTNSAVTLLGSGETVSALGAAGNSAILGGSGDTLTGSHASFTLLQWASATLSGANDTATVAAGAILNVTGSSNTINAAAGSWISVGGDGGLGANVVNGGGLNLTVAENAQASLSGDGDNVHVGANASVNFAGTAARVIGAGIAFTAASGADFLIGNGAQVGAADVVNASHSTIRVGSYADVYISGADDAVAARANSTVNLNGAGMTVHFGLGATGAVGGNGEGGAVDTLRGANFSASILANSNVKLGTLGATVTVGDHATVEIDRKSNVVTAGAFDTFAVWGSGNKVVLGANDVVSDNGIGSVFTVGGSVGGVSLSGFGTDSTALLQLTHGVGGFATANDAYAALTGDGAGGLELSLGSAGALDFVGASLATLTAANFKIG